MISGPCYVSRLPTYFPPLSTQVWSRQYRDGENIEAAEKVSEQGSPHPVSGSTGQPATCNIGQSTLVSKYDI